MKRFFLMISLIAANVFILQAQVRTHPAFPVPYSVSWKAYENYCDELYFVTFYEINQLYKLMDTRNILSLSKIAIEDRDTNAITIFKYDTNRQIIYVDSYDYSTNEQEAYKYKFDAGILSEVTRLIGSDENSDTVKCYFQHDSNGSLTKICELAYKGRSKDTLGISNYFYNADNFIDSIIFTGKVAIAKFDSVIYTRNFCASAIYNFNYTDDNIVSEYEYTNTAANDFVWTLWEKRIYS